MLTFYLIGAVVTFLTHCYQSIIKRSNEYDEKFDHEFLSDKVVLCIMIFMSALLSWAYLFIELITSEPVKKYIRNKINQK